MRCCAGLSGRYVEERVLACHLLLYVCTMYVCRGNCLPNAQQRGGFLHTPCKYQVYHVKTSGCHRLLLIFTYLTHTRLRSTTVIHKISATSKKLLMCMYACYSCIHLPCSPFPGSRQPTPLRSQSDCARESVDRSGKIYTEKAASPA